MGVISSNGINAFALDMFDQFRTVLGLYATDGLLPDPLRETYNGQKNAVDGAVTLGAVQRLSKCVRKQHRRTAQGRRYCHESSRSQASFGGQFPPRIPGLPGARWFRKGAMGIWRDQR